MVLDLKLPWLLIRTGSIWIFRIILPAEESFRAKLGLGAKRQLNGDAFVVRKSTVIGSQVRNKSRSPLRQKEPTTLLVLIANRQLPLLDQPTMRHMMSRQLDFHRPGRLQTGFLH